MGLDSFKHASVTSAIASKSTGYAYPLCSPELEHQIPTNALLPLFAIASKSTGDAWLTVANSHIVFASS
eukprot:7683697-Karenia_brevis.AAC.1